MRRESQSRSPLESGALRKVSFCRLPENSPIPIISDEGDHKALGGGDSTTLSRSTRRRSRWRYFLSSMRKRRKHKKPQSNPPGWAAGRTTEYDLAKRPNRVVIINGEQEAEFVANVVMTAKYKYYNFLPKFLWEEFNPSSKIANVYFLFIAGLQPGLILLRLAVACTCRIGAQVIPSITNTFGVPLMLLPLFFVVCVDAVFMIIEDLARHRADKLANASPTRAWDRSAGIFRRITWKEIQVGDLILIKNREPVPCDVLIMGVNEPNPQSPSGIAYVETKSLDGETNLKIRQVLKGALGLIVAPEDCASLTGSVIMEHPDKLINNFKGKILLSNAKSKRAAASTSPSPSQGGAKSSNAVLSGNASDGNCGSISAHFENNVGALETDESARSSARGDLVETRDRGLVSEPIAPDMLLLRGCVLRNTRWALGLVLNTGSDTKIMMSMSEAPSKASHLSNRINEEIKLVAAVMCATCFLGAALSTVWSSQYHKYKGYLQLEDATGSTRLAWIFFTQFLYYALLLNSFIPISLYVSMNFVRFLQAWFMNQDLDMYYAEGDTPARVRTMNLNEDLGQVSHIFSDKTGTLTCNVMDFRKFSVGGISYGLGITEIGRAAMAAEGEAVPAHVLRADEKAKSNAVPHVNFYDPSVYKDLQGVGEGGQDQAKRIKEFFTALAICHTVIPERSADSDEVMLSASSPDDEALVLGAKYFGIDFVDRVNGTAVLNTWDVFRGPLPRPPATASSRTPPTSRPGLVPEGSTPSPRGMGSFWSRVRTAKMVEYSPKGPRAKTVDGRKGDDPVVTKVSYEVLHILGFTSDRKRMSVIVRTPMGAIKIICKGADTVMLPRLARHLPGAEQSIDATVEHMDTFAREGLRTLVVAQAELNPIAFEEWADNFEEASSDLEEIVRKNKGEPNRIDAAMDIVERDLEIVGASAIEDKLQAGVSEAISDLMAAGIKIWVLTGDKEETAINIAVACQLLWTKTRMHRTVIRLKETGDLETEEIKRDLEDFLQRSIEDRDRFEADETGNVPPPLPRGLIIDGPALLEAMRTPESQAALLRAAQTCHSVVGCRLSPDQKRALVSLVRENLPKTRTLSIGDGANDVPMIQTAHIGVGISGQEGMQAVNASDYAIAQFAYLRKLLLVHGRWNYRRSSRVVCYLFYKSVMFACPLMAYAFFNGYSGTLFYEYITANMYAVLYTALPILLFGTYDRDISAETCLRFPQLYAYGIQDGCMRRTIFWSWILQALIESGFLTLAPLLLLSGDSDTEGVVTSTYDYGTITFSLVVLQVSLKMFWVQRRWTWQHVVVLLVSTFAYFILSFVVNIWMILNWDYHGVVNALLQSRSCWSVMAWCIAVVAGRDWAWKFYHRWWRPRLHHLVLESEKCDENAAARSIKTASSAVESESGGVKITKDPGAAREADLEVEARLHPNPNKSPPLSPASPLTATPPPQSQSQSQPQPQLPHRSVCGVASLETNARSIKDLLESTFSLNPNKPSGEVAVPVTMDALAEAIRELRERDGKPKGSRLGHEFTSSLSMGRWRSTTAISRGSDSPGSVLRPVFGGLAGASTWFGGAGDRQVSRRSNAPLITPTSASAFTEETGASAAEEWGGETGTYDDQFASPVRDKKLLQRRKSRELLRVGELAGRDPRKADELMRAGFSFVEVGDARVGARGPWLSQSTETLRQNNEQCETLSSSRSESSRRGSSMRSSSFPSSEMRASAPGPFRLAPPKPRVVSSTGGYAFSCDPQAQAAEIAMILGHRPGPMNRTRSFYDHQSMLRAKRIVRARGIKAQEAAKRDDGEAGGISSDDDDSDSEGGIGGGWDSETPLQRRRSYVVGSEVSSSPLSQLLVVDAGDGKDQGEDQGEEKGAGRKGH